MIAVSPDTAPGSTTSHAPSAFPLVAGNINNGPASPAASAVAASPSSEALRVAEVVSRLVRYRDHYDNEISQNLERIQDINEAILRYQSEADTNGSKLRAIEMLAASLADAQRCLGDASLARTRIDHELAMWMPSSSSAS
ncbi:hypothetical protein GGI11_002782 [Coemansia sp. RSA 2049]|nr:hypothetical protein GGI11_002782 [Coemansia sp. RSA 2049]KAJ2599770.1 hypothetical protein EV177_007259 [Coemansia sp. RSA 1804]KAJ2678450.1 hypothetical protein GGH99_005664 [Coemansia sp. RSA 1285]